MSDALNKKQLVESIVEQNKITQKEAHDVIDRFTESITNAMSEGKEVSLVGFGRFYVQDVAAREGRNPRTGEPVQIAAHKSPKFKAGQVLKDACEQK